MKATQTTPRQREKEATRRAEAAEAELLELRHALTTYRGWLSDQIDALTERLRTANRRKEPLYGSTVIRTAYVNARKELETFAGTEAQR